MQSFSGHTNTIEAVRFNNSEKLIASGCSAGIVKIWDVEEAKSLYIFLNAVCYLMYHYCVRGFSLKNLAVQDSFII